MRLHHAQQVATLTGERDAARRECAELRERVAGLEVKLLEAENGMKFYQRAFSDGFKARQEVR